MKFSARPSILLNNKEYSPLGVNEGVNFTPGAKFTPRGEVIPWGPGVKLRMSLRILSSKKRMSVHIQKLAC
jgi:hypothetical protein